MWFVLGITAGFIDGYRSTTPPRSQGAGKVPLGTAAGRPEAAARKLAFLPRHARGTPPSAPPGAVAVVAACALEGFRVAGEKVRAARPAPRRPGRAGGRRGKTIESRRENPPPSPSTETMDGWK